MHKSFPSFIVCCMAFSYSIPACTQEATLPPSTALRVVLDRRVRIHKGAILHGHLTEPVYLNDHEVLPAGTLISGTIAGTHPGLKSEHIQRLLAADFTPPKIPDAVFDTLSVPAQGATAAQVVHIDAPAVLTTTSVLTLGTRAKRQSLPSQAVGLVKQEVHDVSDAVLHHFGETVEKYAIGQLPYHPEILWSKTRFNADLAAPAAVLDPAHPTLPVEDLGGHLPGGTLHARLISSLTSQTARKGDVVEAVITQPLLSTDGLRVLVPEGTHLHGVVVQSKPSRSFGRNGDLRFAFRDLDLPGPDGSARAIEIHGKLSGAETTPGQHVSIDEEGQAQAQDGPGKYAEPLLLAALAVAATPHDHHGGPGTGVGPGAQTVSSNGFGVIARIVSLSTRNVSVLEGFAGYSLAKSVYFNFIAKGKNTTFPHDTEIQVTLSER